MDDCLDSLGVAQFFYTLDCNVRYWQIPIAEENKPKTAVTCHCGTYQCTRLHFGLCNAPATFQRAIDMILSGVKWQNALVYLDDPIFFSALPIRTCPFWTQSSPYSGSSGSPSMRRSATSLVTRWSTLAM